MKTVHDFFIIQSTFFGIHTKTSLILTFISTFLLKHPNIFEKFKKERKNLRKPFCSVDTNNYLVGHTANEEIKFCTEPHTFQAP